MLGSYRVRTDLAVESKEKFEKDHVEIKGLQFMKNIRRSLIFALPWCGLRQITERG